MRPLLVMVALLLLAAVSKVMSNPKPTTRKRWSSLWTARTFVSLHRK